MFKLFKTLSRFELLLWIFCVLAVTLSYVAFSHGEILPLAASLVGVSALIFLAKGNYIGQVLTVIFALLYAFVSYKTQYYGEMITYLGMTAPTAALAAVEWILHPYKKGKAEVAVASLNKRKIISMILLTAFVTLAFYFILKQLGNKSLPLSTLSVATSFCASFLMFVRSPYYAIAYAANDIVLIGLWLAVSVENTAFLPVTVCFVCFFLNDIYSFVNWKRMKQKQMNNK